MSLTKLQYRTLARQYLDDPNSKRWTDANFDLLTQLVYDGLYGDILDVAPYWNSKYQQIPLPLHTPGYIDLKTTTASGDLTGRFYRLQQLIADGRHYFAKDPRDFLMTARSNTGDVTTIEASVGVEQRFSYQFLGDQLWLHPLGQVTTFVEMRYNFRPTLYTSLSDTDSVDFPEGAEHAVILLTAAHAMAKGAAEDSSQLLALGEGARQRLLDTVRRRSHGPTQPFASEMPWAIGGT